PRPLAARRALAALLLAGLAARWGVGRRGGGGPSGPGPALSLPQLPGLRTKELQKQAEEAERARQKEEEERRKEEEKEAEKERLRQEEAEKKAEEKRRREEVEEAERKRQELLEMEEKALKKAQARARRPLNPYEERRVRRQVRSQMAGGAPGGVTLARKQKGIWALAGRADDGGRPPKPEVKA
ncbi:unnamed protein product, partial [Prorocentrum cordatum]